MLLSKLDETETTTQKITPPLWFEDNAEEAAKFYTSIFKNSNNRYYPLRRISCRGIRKTKGSVMTVIFELEEQQFIALNGGPTFKFSPAISFLVSCETQQKVDSLWKKLSEGG